MTEREWSFGPFLFGYANDVGPNDEGFLEWWEVTDAQGNSLARCDDEEKARFFSAAPDLYEALEEAREYVEMYDTVGQNTIQTRSLSLIDAALAKARGEPK